MRILLNKGADVNARAIDGRTALMKAVESGDMSTAKVLIDYGADVNAKDDYGETVLMMAEFVGQEMQKFIRQAGARKGRDVKL